MSLKSGIINAPKHLLGNHDYGDGQVIMVYRPHAEKVCVVSPTGKNRDEMECLSDGVYGFYSAKKKYKEQNTGLRRHIRMVRQL